MLLRLHNVGQDDEATFGLQQLLRDHELFGLLGQDERGLQLLEVSLVFRRYFDLKQGT